MDSLSERGGLEHETLIHLISCFQALQIHPVHEYILGNIALFQGIIPDLWGITPCFCEMIN